MLCALLRGFTLDIANVGDTRAVLGRKATAHPKFSGRVSLRERDLEALRLSIDHKPNLPAETRRVQQAGGNVRQISGCWRVAGPPGCATLLAISRALGDKVGSSCERASLHTPCPSSFPTSHDLIRSCPIFFADLRV